MKLLGGSFNYFFSKFINNLSSGFIYTSFSIFKYTLLENLHILYNKFKYFFDRLDVSTYCPK